MIMETGRRNVLQYHKIINVERESRDFYLAAV